MSADAIHTRVADLSDRVLDSIIVGLQDYSTEELRSVCEHRDEINPGGWFQQMIRDYIEVWR